MTGRCTQCFSLRDDEIDVWTVRLIDNCAATAEFAAILDGDERARAARFAFEQDRTYFIQSHVFLRRMLARYTGVDAADLTFTRGCHGKPQLMLTSNGPNVRFSLSHSGDRCVVAVRLRHALGVDLEELRDLPQALEIAQRQFAPNESRLLASLSGAAQRDAFLALWTHKEAVVKALGASLAASLRPLEFDIDLIGRPRLKSWNGDRSIVREWSVLGIDCGPGHIGAVATVHPFRTLRQQFWSDIGTIGEIGQVQRRPC